MEDQDESTELLSYAVYAAGVFGILFFIRRYLKGAQFNERVSAKGKVAVVTGANCGIGFETVKELNLKKAKVYMLCRSEEKAFEAKKDLVKLGCDISRLIFVECDLTSFKSIRAAAEEILKAEDHIDILINNAGIMFVPKWELTEDEHEKTWQSNHLGPFFLTELLLPAIKNSESGRIVITSSRINENSGRIDLSQIDSKKHFGTTNSYVESKLANIMHARGLSRVLRRSGIHNITVNSLHPGIVNTELWRETFIFASFLKKISAPFRWFLMKTSRDGAQTTLYLALSKKIEGVSGKYFADCDFAKENPLALDDDACDDLYNYSLEQTGLRGSKSID